MRPIAVVNNYGQFNHLIHRTLRDLGIPVTLVSNTTDPDDIAERYGGIILGGGPAIERAGNCAQYLALGLPVLGICLGLHVIATASGGRVQPGKSGGYGPVEVTICDHDAILAGYPGSIRVWASHADEVVGIPPGFDLLATSDICGAEAIALPSRNLYGIQWHPEVSHTEDGNRIFENFYAIVREYGAC
ncbi:MAG TPA: GMP synthase subunit A [Methanoregulaceae archaeon]|nr:GMP synthase subunit A [Methanoregulaceae archaeon]HPD74653.1 GMP synthase subunit A [Methanoregulaceae archaeon]HRY75138.1 GMP synthase subunit A [Methanoregulaceae archaeon]